jgi:hypothetical protein
LENRGVRSHFFWEDLQLFQPYLIPKTKNI